MNDQIWCLCKCVYNFLRKYLNRAMEFYGVKCQHRKWWRWWANCGGMWRASSPPPYVFEMIIFLEHHRSLFRLMCHCHAVWCCVQSVSILCMAKLQCDCYSQSVEDIRGRPHLLCKCRCLYLFLCVFMFHKCFWHVQSLHFNSIPEKSQAICTNYVHA